MQRKKLDITDPRNLVNVMQENNHRYQSGTAIVGPDLLLTFLQVQERDY